MAQSFYFCRNKDLEVEVEVEVVLGIIKTSDIAGLGNTPALHNNTLPSNSFFPKTLDLPQCARRSDAFSREIRIHFTCQVVLSEFRENSPAEISSNFETFVNP